MSKNETQATAKDAAAPDELAAQSVTLTEFCMRLSAGDRRVEMIAGFEASERAAGKLRDSEAAFRGRYADFIIKPV